jgi:hypothetical protein
MRQDLGNELDCDGYADKKRIKQITVKKIINKQMSEDFGSDINFVKTFE